MMATAHLPDITTVAADLVVVQPVYDAHRRFLNDCELVAMAALFNEARALCAGSFVPVSTRAELRAVCWELGLILHGAPHVRTKAAS